MEWDTHPQSHLGKYNQSPCPRSLLCDTFSWCGGRLGYKPKSTGSGSPIERMRLEMRRPKAETRGSLAYFLKNEAVSGVPAVTEKSSALPCQHVTVSFCGGCYPWWKSQFCQFSLAFSKNLSEN